MNNQVFWDGKQLPACWKIEMSIFLRVKQSYN